MSERSDDIWCSVRMRTSASGAHLSGGERLVPLVSAHVRAAELLQRGISSTGGRAASVVLTCDLVPADDILTVTALEIITEPATTVPDSRTRAQSLLRSWGVSDVASRVAIASIEHGVSPMGRSMRGAMIIDAASGARLEDDPERGVRVSFVDMTEASCRAFSAEHGDQLPRPRMREALTLASKIAALPSVRAELCWSDDPDYVTGYVACRSEGYHRLTPMKQAGVPTGGRAIFVDARLYDPLRDIEFLRRAPVLVELSGVTDTEEA